MHKHSLMAICVAGLLVIVGGITLLVSTLFMSEKDPLNGYPQLIITHGLKNKYDSYLKSNYHKAFAIGPHGESGIATARRTKALAQSNALAECKLIKGAECTIVSTNQDKTSDPRSGTLSPQQSKNTDFKPHHDTPSVLSTLLAIKQWNNYLKDKSPKAFAVGKTGRVGSSSETANSENEAQAQALAECRKHDYFCSLISINGKTLEDYNSSLETKTHQEEEPFVLDYDL